jgi:hypothetical protein
VQRLHIGTPQDLLESHKAGVINGKILNALHFPFPYPPLGSAPLEALGTDVAAFNSTADLEFCKVTYHPFPFGSTSWGLCATYNAHHKLHIDMDGFATCIEVKNEGSCKWWVIATPKCNHGTASTSLFTNGFAIDKIDTEMFDFEAILLTTNMEL